jgi:hypothetical protein
MSSLISSLISSLSAVSLAILRLLSAICPSAALLGTIVSVVTPEPGVLRSTGVLSSTVVLSGAADELSATGVLSASVGQTSRPATTSHHSESITVVHLLNTTIISLRHIAQRHTNLAIKSKENYELPKTNTQLLNRIYRKIKRAV